MPPLGLLQLIAAVVSILKNAYDLQQAINQGLSEAEIKARRNVLRSSYQQLEKALTPQEIIDAEEATTRTHRDILK
jgi:hypothetical protein